MKKLNYVIKNTFINMRRNPLLVIATMLAVLVSSFLVFTTLSARAIVENNTSRWQNGVHVVIFLDDRVTSTAHQQLQETLESYSEVRMVEYFSKSEATEEFKTLFFSNDGEHFSLNQQINDNKSLLKITDDPLNAVSGANVLYTDVWSSMGEENQKKEKDVHFNGFTIDNDLVRKADKDAIILHCLPAYRNKEITDAVIESEKSRIFQQAENRLHIQQGLLACLLS